MVILLEKIIVQMKLQLFSSILSQYVDITVLVVSITDYNRL